MRSTSATSRTPDRVLTYQLRWMVNLRWLAGMAILVGTGFDAITLRQFTHTWILAGTGLAILSYNVLLLAALNLPRLSKDIKPVVLAWLQVGLDLACLATLALATGGSRSPLLFLFVLHMVFASLLLSRFMAYSAALLSVLLVVAGLGVSERWPRSMEESLTIAGWALALLLTVYLSNEMSLGLRRHQQRLLARNRRIRSLLDQMRRQQHVLVQHEKMVAMGQMAAGVAHEIANPLANMDSLLQLMQRNAQRLNLENVSTLRQQIERIKLTVQQLTSYAHPTEFEWRVIPMKEIVDTSLEMVRFDRRRRATHIERQMVGDCQVRVQPHAVQQVLVNVLLNALDAAADVPEPKVTICTQCRDSFCHILVTDNGVGIAPEHMAHIFEPFFTTKPVGKGTGLGLAISHSLIRNQSGRIDITSQPGKGTTVDIALPRLAPGTGLATPQSNQPS